MKKNQNIIFFSNTLWFLEKFKYELIKETSKKNNVTCIYLRDGPIYRKDKINNLIKINQVSFYNLKVFLKKEILQKFLSIFFHRLNRVSYQKIIIFNIGPILLSFLLSDYNKKKIVYVLEGMGRVFSSKGFKNLFIKNIVIGIYRLLFKKCFLVCVLNSSDALFLVENNICNINKISILPGTGLNLKNIDKEFRSKKIQPRYIDYIGRIIIEKGFYKFLFIKYNFSKYYPEYEKKYIFRIICPQEDIEKLSKDKLDYLKNNKIYLQPYKSSPYEYYKESKALIVASTYGEGLSRVILEACYLGIPILASRSKGIEEVFPNNYKYFIKTYNPFSMSQQLAEMINDAKYFDEIREKLKLNIKNNFSVEKSIYEFNSRVFNN